MLLVGGGFWWMDRLPHETWHATSVTCERIDIEVKFVATGSHVKLHNFFKKTTTRV